MDDEADGIFNIALSDSESEEKTATKPAGRTDQSEEAYQAVKRTYHAKVENGDIYKGVKLPLERGARKPQIQEVIYAAEELYFFRRFAEAVDFLSKVLSQGDDRSEAFDDETRALLTVYKQKCEAKLTKHIS